MGFGLVELLVGLVVIAGLLILVIRMIGGRGK